MPTSEFDKPSVTRNQRYTMEKLLEKTKAALAKAETGDSSIDQHKVILPVIKNLMPNIIADEICSVQPMTADMINPFSIKWEPCIGIDSPTGHAIYNVRDKEIKDWIESQPVHMWKFYDMPVAIIGQAYMFTKEMEAWFQLRWS